jgi:hypothetical protein
MFFLPLKRRPLMVLGIASVAALVVILAVKHVGKDGAETASQADRDLTHRHIEYHFSLRNDSNQLLEKAEFWTYGPVAATGAQKCTSLQANHPYKLSVDALGNQVLHFTFPKLPPFSTKLIHIQADVDLSSASGKVQESSLDEFLGEEDLVESNSREVVNLAKQLKGRNPLETAQNIYGWISENLRYTGFHAADRGALYALKRKRGDCTEYMSLFVALCRASGIPARRIGGYVCAGDMILKAGDYHHWAEFYGGEGWQSVDPQKRVFGINGRGYIAMRIIGRLTANPMGDMPRFRSAGQGVKVRMES